MMRVLRSGSSASVLGEKVGKALMAARRRKGRSVENRKRPIWEAFIVNAATSN